MLCACMLTPVAGAGAATRAHRSAAPHGNARVLKRRAKPKPRKGPPPLSGPAVHALASYEAMQKYFYISGSDLYREELNQQSNSYLWPFSQAIAATITVAHIPGQQAKARFSTGAQVHGLQKYLSTAPPNAVSSTEALQSLPHYTATIATASTDGTTFYDDNDWVGIEMVRLFELTHDEAALSLAEQILAFEEAGWVSNSNEPCPGGIPHSDSDEDEFRSTITSAPAAELAVQLYRVTGNGSYLQFAETAYNWVRECLAMSSGLYADHVEANGELDPEPWSYIQGVMIGAGALLYQATGDSGYLGQAETTANMAVSAFPLNVVGGENPFFAVVFFRNLIYLDSIVRNPTGTALAQQYVNWAWNSLHESNGLFADREGGKATLLDQASLTQIYALLATNPATYF